MVMAALAQLTTPVMNRVHIRGSASALVTLVEYGDYSCPRCNEARFVARQLRPSRGDRLRYAFRNFLMLSFRAQSPSCGGSCRGFADHQAALSDKHLKFYATQVGFASIATFRSVFMLPRVHEDIMSARHNGVSATPVLLHQRYPVPGIVRFSDHADANRGLSRNWPGFAKEYDGFVDKWQLDREPYYLETNTLGCLLRATFVTDRRSAALPLSAKAQWRSLLLPGKSRGLWFSDKS